MDTSTPEGQLKRIDELTKGNPFANVRIIGGSVADYDEKYDPSLSGSHPDEL